jgi:hypothetical protein
MMDSRVILVLSATVSVASPSAARIRVMATRSSISAVASMRLPRALTLKVNWAVADVPSFGKAVTEDWHLAHHHPA